MQQLYETLQGDDEAQRIEAAEIIRSLIDRIVLTPGEDRIEIDVQGDLAGILTLSAQRKNRAADAAGSQVKMVAGQDLNLRPSGYEPMEGQNRIISETSDLRGKPLFWRDFDPRKHPRQHGLRGKTGTKPAVAG